MILIQAIATTPDQSWEYGNILSCLALLVSIVAWVTTRQKHKQDIIPILVFYRRRPIRGEKWVVKNVGFGPALNIKIKEADGQGLWYNLPFPYPIGANESQELDDLRSADQLKATYTNFWGDQYSTICGNNVNRFSKQSFRIREELISPNALK